jgi:beta-1,4-mannooligosaccharide/beta-1,4-mannosyl-N-acetylglucosamine phosphorylase
MSSPLSRHPSNPLVVADQIGGDSILVFNPGVARFDGRYFMALRSDTGTIGNPNITGSAIHFAWSDDGVSWKPAEQPPLDRLAAIRLLQPLEPHWDLEQVLWRIYDPRLVTVDLDGQPTLVMNFAVDTTRGLRAGMAMSRDGLEWEPLHLGAPDNRNQALFPEKIGDHWYRLERPMQHYGGEGMGSGMFGAWVSRSPDLRFWGDTRFVTDRHAFPYAGDKVGPGAPPVRTEAGWLAVMHAVSVDPTAGKRGWEPQWQKTYRAGAVLLDLDDPSKVIAAASEPLLEPHPDAPYERDGYRNDVIFPCASLVVDQGGVDELWVYYGAADTSIALASAPLSDVIDWITASA